jgi:hypothetical protein
MQAAANVYIFRGMLRGTGSKGAGRESHIGRGHRRNRVVQWGMERLAQLARR